MARMPARSLRQTIRSWFLPHRQPALRRKGAGTRLAVEALGDRITPSLSAALDSGSLTITDADTAGEENALTVVRSDTDLVITHANETFDAAPAGGTLSNGDRTLILPMASVTGSLTVNGQG